MKIQLSEQTRINLDELLSDDISATKDAVRTVTVRTDTVSHTVRTEKDAVRTDEVNKGKFNKYHDVYPERIEVCFKRGVKSSLKEWSSQRGYSSVSTMIRSAIKFAISHSEFKNGWDKQ